LILLFQHFVSPFGDRDARLRVTCGFRRERVTNSRAQI
jgi:hypothetical protein